MAAVSVNGMGMFPIWLLGAMAADVQADLGFGVAALGAAVASFQAISAAISLPAGFVAERHGFRVGSLATIALFIFATTGIALFTTNWTHLVAWLAFAALASGLSGPTANLGLANLVPPAQQGLAFGIKQASSPAGTTLAGLAIPVIALTIGWRWAFGLSALAAIPLALIIPRPPPVSSGRRAQLRARREMLRPLVLLSVGGGLGTASTNSVAAFFVISAIDGGIAPATAGLTLAAGGIITIVVRILVGWQADRRGRRHLIVVAAMMTAGAIGTVAIGFATGPGSLLGAALLAYGLGWGWNGLFDFAVVRQMPRTPAAATGVTQTGKYVGGVLGPLSFGVTVEALGYRTAWIGAGAVLFLAALTVLVARLRIRALRNE